MSGSSSIDIIDYKIISNDVERLYRGVEALKKKRVAANEGFESLRAHLRNRNFNHSFSAMEKEINDIIGTWTILDPIADLQTQLDGCFNKISDIDRVIDEIETVQEQLLQYPDRHNRKSVTDGINVFLQNVNKITLSQIDKICNETAPNFHKLVNSVLQGFSKEKNSVAKNKKEAQDLKNRLDAYNQYVDRFDLRQICTEAYKVAVQILQTPNMLNPEEDTIRLQKSQRQINQCIDQFEAEQIRYDSLKQLLSDNASSIWAADYKSIMRELEKGAYFSAAPISQLQAQYDVVVGIKENDISKAMSSFSVKIQSLFSNEIRALRESQCDREDLRNLITRMNSKLEGERKKRIMQGIKYLGIAIAAGIFICVVITVIIPWVIANWGWILLGLAIIGFIIYKISNND